ncbi:hypothetical protein SAMN05428642_1011244 [Flaviramulus basaltis]|uniref:Uncharacterized protein n=1 Tax=Flaviramulus basaltis TaxID=369401 RepID=A0A1K2IEV4_9FLAO|nr:hypothetical protein SAMN05428642_1011244 [Flaviramulus basaltis]
MFKESVMVKLTNFSEFMCKMRCKNENYFPLKFTF